MVVFPGGAVDDDDRGVKARSIVPRADVPGLDPGAAAAFLSAGLRETLEEVGIWVGGDAPIDPLEFPHAGWWLTPVGATRRYDTHFFLARFRGGDVTADRQELSDAWWDRPAELLERVGTGELDAIYPTIQFLRSLARFSSVDQVITAANERLVDRDDDGWVSF